MQAVEGLKVKLVEPILLQFAHLVQSISNQLVDYSNVTADSNFELLEKKNLGRVIDHHHLRVDLLLVKALF